MKKIFACIVLVITLVGTSVLPLNQLLAQSKAPAISIYIDGSKLSLTAQPFIENGRTLVPLRGVFEKLGATVDWNKETNQVIVKNDTIEILLEIGNQAVLVNGEVEFLDTPSQLQASSTMVPVRFIAESLGHKVDWDELTNRVDITTQKPVAVVQNKQLPTLGSAEAFSQLLHYNRALDSYINHRLFTFGGPELLVTTAQPAVSEDSIAPSNQETQTKSSDDFSDTNVQTEGVDEGDILKTNGQNIFSLNQNRIFILDPNPSTPVILSTIDVPDVRGSVSDLYIEGNQLVIIGTSWVQYGYPKDLVAPFGPDFYPSYSTSNTFVLVYDVSNPIKPTLSKDLDFEGSYVSSRLINDKLYVISSKDLNYWGVEPLYRMAIDTGADKISSMIAANSNGPIKPIDLSDADYKAQLNKLYNYQFQPKYANNLTGQTTLVDYDQIRYFPDYITPNYMLTIGIDLASDAIDVKTYLGSAEIVYASANNLYLSFTKYQYAGQYNTLIYVPSYDKTTTIYKFSLEDGQINYVAKGSVPGSALNQYSLDEYNDNLRIATTTGEMWDQSNVSKNNIYVLNSTLETVGQLTDLAPGERIYSTRFAGNRIYMVTFRQVDPFFVIDATDPTAPKVLGDLKIPGFSTYMHILDENHVLGFGSDTVESDGRVTTGGFKISLFDVTNPAAPIEKNKEVIGVAGTYSELQNNPKALMISLSKGIMAFPISVAGKAPYVNDFSGAYVYNITKDSFSYKGTVTHQSDATLQGEGDYKYYDYNYNVNRLLYIGDYLYSLSFGKMEVTNLIDMTKKSEVTFPAKVYSNGGTISIDAVTAPSLAK